MNTETNHQIRNTVQRSAVLNTVRELFHPTADEVYSAIRENYPAISRGTVYRNLKILTELGELRWISALSGPDRYDARPMDHYHIQCRICGKLFDVDMPYANTLEREISDTHGFIFEGHDIVFRGVCPHCNCQYCSEQSETEKEPIQGE